MCESSFVNLVKIEFGEPGSISTYPAGSILRRCEYRVVCRPRPVLELTRPVSSLSRALKHLEALTCPLLTVRRTPSFPARAFRNLAIPQPARALALTWRSLLFYMSLASFSAAYLLTRSILLKHITMSRPSASTATRILSSNSRSGAGSWHAMTITA